MHKGRLEAFSDGVLAIVITIMVLELKVPHGEDLASLEPLFPVFLSYLLSFVYVGIYWNNHHHLFQAAKHVNGAILWANLHLLFWLSLFPFVTGWVGENHFAPVPVAIYGVVLIMAGVAYYILSRVLLIGHGPESTLARAIGSDLKGKSPWSSTPLESRWPTTSRGSRWACTRSSPSSGSCPIGGSRRAWRRAETSVPPDRRRGSGARRTESRAAFG